MEIGESINIAISAMPEKDKCPFCGKAPHDFGQKDGDEDVEVVSKPSQLKCSMTNGKTKRRGTSDASKKEYAYTMAAHHLISAKQCFAKLAPLVKMATMAKYDINDSHNGIGLPTTYHTLRYPSSDGMQYGDLSNDQKIAVSFSIMGELGAQWHVGHHSFKYEITWEQPADNAGDDWGDEVDEKEPAGHQQGYDEAIIGKLIDIMFSFNSSSAPICDDPEKAESKVDQKLQDLSKEIKTELEKFSGKKPWDAQLYVSNKAFEYAQYRRKKKGEKLPSFQLPNSTMNDSHNASGARGL